MKKVGHGHVFHNFLLLSFQNIITVLMFLNGDGFLEDAPHDVEENIILQKNSAFVIGNPVELHYLPWSQVSCISIRDTESAVVTLTQVNKG